MEIRITCTPPGEAPESVSAAWVGVVLPLAKSGVRSIHTVGVLSRPRTWLGLLAARLLGKTEIQKGYIVDAPRAVELLDAHAPNAAKWWRENAASAVQPGRLFLFAAESCQELTR